MSKICNCTLCLLTIYQISDDDQLFQWKGNLYKICQILHSKENFNYNKLKKELATQNKIQFIIKEEDEKEQGDRYFNKNWDIYLIKFATTATPTDQYKNNLIFLLLNPNKTAKDIYQLIYERKLVTTKAFSIFGGNNNECFIELNDKMSSIYSYHKTYPNVLFINEGYDEQYYNNAYHCKFGINKNYFFFFIKICFFFYKNFFFFFIKFLFIQFIFFIYKKVDIKSFKIIDGDGLYKGLDNQSHYFTFYQNANRYVLSSKDFHLLDNDWEEVVTHTIKAIMNTIHGGKKKYMKSAKLLQIRLILITDNYMFESAEIRRTSDFSKVELIGITHENYDEFVELKNSNEPDDHYIGMKLTFIPNPITSKIRLLQFKPIDCVYKKNDFFYPFHLLKGLKLKKFQPLKVIKPTIQSIKTPETRNDCQVMIMEFAFLMGTSSITKKDIQNILNQSIEFADLYDGKNDLEHSHIIQKVKRYDAIKTIRYAVETKNWNFIIETITDFTNKRSIPELYSAIVIAASKKFWIQFIKSDDTYVLFYSNDPQIVYFYKNDLVEYLQNNFRSKRIKYSIIKTKKQLPEDLRPGKTLTQLNDMAKKYGSYDSSYSSSYDSSEEEKENIQSKDTRQKGTQDNTSSQVSSLLQPIQVSTTTTN